MEATLSSVRSFQQPRFITPVSSLQVSPALEIAQQQAQMNQHEFCSSAPQQVVQTVNSTCFSPNGARPTGASWSYCKKTEPLLTIGFVADVPETSWNNNSYA